MSAAAAFKAREAEIGTAPSDIELPSYSVSDAGTSQAGDLASPDRAVSALSAPSPTPSEAGLDADEDGPPPYSPSTAFVPTVQLQIETSGKQWLSLPSPPRPDPIPVYPVDAGGATDSSNPIYLSLRPKRSSGSCTLVRFDEPNGTALSSTSYFFGPGRYAEIKLGGVPLIADSKDKKKDKKNKKKTDTSPVHSPSASTAELATESNHIELPAEVPIASTSISAVANPISVPDWASFELKPVGTFTRAVRFTTPLGLFEWRYAGRKERKELGMDSLLVMDHIVRVFRVQDRQPLSPSQNPAQMGSSFRRLGRGNNNNSSSPAVAVSSGGGVEQDEQRTPVARFLRNAELRSPGSGPATAGNGGRLVLDLSKWGENSKTDREAVEILAVTTCVSMLKKEVDRRRHQQIAIMAAAAS